MHRATRFQEGKTRGNPADNNTFLPSLGGPTGSFRLLLCTTLSGGCAKHLCSCSRCQVPPESSALIPTSLFPSIPRDWEPKPMLRVQCCRENPSGSRCADSALKIYLTSLLTGSEFSSVAAAVASKVPAHVDSMKFCKMRTVVCCPRRRV